MRRDGLKKSVLTFGIAGFALIASATSTSAQWSQWGGPNRDFHVDTQSLASQWPEGGPVELWARPLGTGYSGLAVEGGRLYTMYRTSNDDEFEYTVAIDLETANTIWEHKQSARVPESVADYGKRYSGPNATPLVTGGRVYTVGRNGMLHCFQAEDGEILWKQDLREDFGAQTHTCGFSSSPIAYDDSIILSVGRVAENTFGGTSVLAFDQETGEVIWTSQSFESWHSSPIMITRAGKPQLVQCTTSSLVGLDPSDGSRQWQYSFPNAEDYEAIWATPVWDGQDTILFSSRRTSYAVKLNQMGEKTETELLWSNPTSPLGMGTPILIDGLLMGPQNGQSPAFMALDIETGERKWITRQFRGATMVGGAGKLIILDQGGELSLVNFDQESLTVASQHQLTEEYSFTAPALVGTTLYVRDENRLVALDLSVEGNSSAQ